jgi:predicted enzyme related to lactoylglutathione lyase
MDYGVSVVWFPVTDMDRAVAFYEGTLGLKKAGAEAEWAEFEVGGVTVGLNAREEESPGGDGGGVLAFSPTGSLEDAVEELKAKDVEFAGGISEHAWGRIAAFTDPDGNALQLYEAPAG